MNRTSRAKAVNGVQTRVIGAKSSLTVTRKDTSNLSNKAPWPTETPIKVEGGILKILDYVDAKVTGGLTHNMQTANVLMTSGKLIIEGGSKLEAPDKVLTTGGKIATRTTPYRSTTATITGKLYNTGADVVIGDDEPDVGSSAVLGKTHTFGVLKVTGDVHWSGGVYRPALGPNGTSDRWTSDGDFFITGGAAGAQLGPTIKDVAEANMINVVYTIIEAGGTVQYLNGTELGAEDAVVPGDWSVFRWGANKEVRIKKLR